MSSHDQARRDYLAAVRGRLKALGLTSDSPRVTTWLQRVGLTRLEDAPLEALQSLEERLQQLSPREPEDLGGQIARIETELNRLGVNKRGLLMLCWLRHEGYNRWEDLDAAGLERLERDLKQLKQAI